MLTGDSASEKPSLTLHSCQRAETHEVFQGSKEYNNLSQYDQFDPYLYQYETPDMRHAANLAATIELKIEDLYDDVDLRTKRSTSTAGANPATSQLHSVSSHICFTEQSVCRLAI